jgi:hypothetical protein
MRARRRFAVTAFRLRGRLTSYGVYLKSKRRLGRCSPGHELGRAAVRGCRRQDQAAARTGCSWTGCGSAHLGLLILQDDTCGSCEGVKGVSLACGLPAASNCLGTVYLRWRGQSNYRACGLRLGKEESTTLLATRQGYRVDLRW